MLSHHIPRRLASLSSLVWLSGYLVVLSLVLLTPVVIDAKDTQGADKGGFIYKQEILSKQGE